MTDFRSKLHFFSHIFSYFTAGKLSLHMHNEVCDTQKYLIQWELLKICLLLLLPSSSMTRYFCCQKKLQNNVAILLIILSESILWQIRVILSNSPWSSVFLWQKVSILKMQAFFVMSRNGTGVVLLREST